MSTRSLIRTLALSAGVLSSAAAADADVIYSNFGPGDTYLLNIGETLSYGGPLGGDAYEHAVPFTVMGGDYFLDSAEVAIAHYFGPDLVFADLRSDAGGSPGEVLETTRGAGTSPPDMLAPPLLLAFGGDLMLEEGATYWLAIRTDRTDALLGWAHNNVKDFGLRAWRVNEGPWNPVFGDPQTDTDRAVFRITATPVPGPGALGLAGVWMVGVVRRRRCS